MVRRLAMLFNLNKCKVIHFGKHNSCASYQLGGKDLEAVKEERDLVIIIQDDLKISKQCVKAVSSANKVLRMISHTFEYKSKDVTEQLYKTLVRPHKRGGHV